MNENEKNDKKGGQKPKKGNFRPVDKEKNKEKESFPPIVGDVEIVGINFHDAGKIYYFSPAGIAFRVGDRAIVETSRGVEIGTVKIANRIMDGKDIVPPLKAVMRKATTEDLAHDAANRQAEAEATAVCKKKIAAHKLDMNLVGAEYTFDNAKLTFYFTCETRVDFRDLVKDLASTFRTRIELRQIGIRDEAKMLGGLGLCGRKLCCANFLTDFVQVSIKMAKEQNFSLNSAKVSGACGRLMCCLRYEHEVYEAALKVTPPTGTTVETPDGVGVIVETKPLTEQIRVRLNVKDKEEMRQYRIADVKILRTPGKAEAKPTPENKDRGKDKTSAE